MSEGVRKDDTGASASAIGEQAFSTPAGPPPAYEDRELPPGWVKQFDRRASLGINISLLDLTFVFFLLWYT